MSTKAVHDAMTNHAIQFGKWLRESGYFPAPTEEDMWYQKADERKSTEQLYQIYIKLPE